MHKLAEKNRDKLIDLLNERLTFERAGVKLYDSILQKLERTTSGRATDRIVGELRRHRDEEKEHEEFLEGEIRSLGGDAHAETEMSRLVTMESEGIEKIVLDGDMEPMHLFHALLTAELADNAGWELLVELATLAGDFEARRAFKKRLREEEDHLELARKMMAAFAARRVFGPAEPLAAGILR